MGGLSFCDTGGVSAGETENVCEETASVSEMEATVRRTRHDSSEYGGGRRGRSWGGLSL